MNRLWESGTEFSQIVSIDWLLVNFADPQLRLIDVRSEAQYLTGHIPGAVHWDLNLLRLRDSSPGELISFHETAEAELKTSGTNSNERVVFYEDFSGACAARGVWLFDYLGIPASAMLDGGLLAWTKAGGEIVSEPTLNSAGNATTSIQNELLTGVDEILEAISGEMENVLILDTRSALEHQIGTIPTSTHLEWSQHLDADGAMSPRAELRELYRSHGLESDSDGSVITFCGGGYRAAHSYLVLKELGFTTIKNYAPSWGEWGTRADLPVEHPSRS